MLQEHDEANEHTPQHSHHHACANFFGCGDVKGVGIFREDIKDRAFDSRASDRLLHMDEVDQESLDNYLSVRGRWRRKFLQASGFLGALAAVDPWFVKLAPAGQFDTARKRESDQGEGRVHLVPSTKETVKLGVYDTNLPPILTIDSGESISFPETWSGFLNELQPGVPIDTLVKIRLNNPGKGPQSIIGPIAVNKAAPGDVLEIRYKRIRPCEWGAVYINPGALGTGLLPQDYPDGRSTARWLFPAVEPWRDDRCAARATCGQSRSQRVVRGIDALHTSVETGSPHLYGRQPRRTGRWRDLPLSRRDLHE
jgi:hypothetical protein